MMQEFLNLLVYLVSFAIQLILAQILRLHSEAQKDLFKFIVEDVFKMLDHLILYHFDILCLASINVHF
jgi:hypothetical protein